ncbi:MAG: hypothetical protein ACOX87_14905, partial [Chloroflexota bacterium]
MPLLDSAGHPLAAKGRLFRALSIISLWLFVVVAAACEGETSLPPSTSLPATVTQAEALQTQTTTPTETTPPTATAAPSNTPTPLTSQTSESTHATPATPSQISYTPVPVDRTSTSTATAQSIPTATILPPNLSGERALGYVRGLAVDIGSRPSNSPASQQAAQYIQRQLSYLGY